MMGELVKRTFRINCEQRTLQEIESVAEGAALMQEQHARDLISLADTARIRKSDKRLKRARRTLDLLK